jgi:hypothetical protein
MLQTNLALEVRKKLSQRDGNTIYRYSKHGHKRVSKIATELNETLNET